MNVSTKQKRIAELARKDRSRVLTSVNHFIDVNWLVAAYQQTRKDGAVGVDRITAETYQENLLNNLTSLVDRLRSGSYQAVPVKRVYILKSNGKKRPLGIPSFEEKIAQRAVVMLLEPIYEETFKGYSFGFRERKSAHEALEYLRNQIMDCNGRWIIDIDIAQYFDTINHQQLRKFLDKRVTDGVIRKLIDKWIKVGVSENGTTRRNYLGIVQGNVLSPLLANIYLHYVLDEWFEASLQPCMGGRCSLTRFADDSVMAFEREADCRRAYSVLEKRLKKYHLDFNTEKSKIIAFHATNKTQSIPKESRTFNFLGFTHYWKKSRRGYDVVGRRTKKAKLSEAIKAFNVYCKHHRHCSLEEQHKMLGQMLTGHYAYFGITGNYRSLSLLEQRVIWIWRKWLSRRSRQSRITWERFELILKRFPLPKPKIYHRYYR